MANDAHDTQSLSTRTLPVTQFLCDGCNRASTPGDAFASGWVIALSTLYCDSCALPSTREAFGAATLGELLRVRDELHERLRNMPRGLWTSRECLPFARDVRALQATLADELFGDATLYHLSRESVEAVRAIADELTDEDVECTMIEHLPADAGIIGGGGPLGKGVAWCKLPSGNLAVVSAAFDELGSAGLPVLVSGDVAKHIRLYHWVAALFLALADTSLVETQPVREGRPSGLHKNRRKGPRKSASPAYTVSLREPAKTGRPGHGIGGGPLRFQAPVCEHLRRLKSGKVTVVRAHVRGKGLPVRPAPVFTV